MLTTSTLWWEGIRQRLDKPRANGRLLIDLPSGGLRGTQHELGHYPTPRQGAPKTHYDDHPFPYTPSDGEEKLGLPAKVKTKNSLDDDQIYFY